MPLAADPYWEPPLDGTLVKSTVDPTVYVIENRTKRPLSLNAFSSRGYSFANIKNLPAVEITVIAPGSQVP